MDSARNDPFGPQLAASASSEDQSGLRLRSEWLDEAGHRLDATEEASDDSLDLLPSLYSEDWDTDDTVVADTAAFRDPEPSLELDIEVAESGSLELDIEVAESGSLELDIEVDLDPEPANGPQRVELEAAVALRSDSHLWEGFDGELGVFVATVRELPIGTAVSLTLHLTGEPTVTVPTTVRFLRDDPTQWPGLGLELDRPTHYLREAFRRFARLRPAAFHG
jgi:hypothetical protein